MTTTDSTQQDHKSLYSLLMEGLYDALLVTDPNGHLIEMNPRAVEYFQYERGDVWDKPISVLIPGVTPQVIQRIRKGIEDARNMMLDARCQRKDQSGFTAEVTVCMVNLVNEGDLVFTVRNTERRRKQLQALRSQANAFQVAQSACFVCGQDRVFKVVNEAFVRMFGFEDADAVVGKKTFDEVMPDDPLPAFFDRALEGETLAYRVEADQDDGEKEVVEVQLAPDAQGKDGILGVVGSVVVPAD